MQCFRWKACSSDLVAILDFDTFTEEQGNCDSWLSFIILKNIYL